MPIPIVIKQLNLLANASRATKDVIGYAKVCVDIIQFIINYVTTCVCSKTYHKVLCI